MTGARHPGADPIGVGIVGAGFFGGMIGEAMSHRPDFDVRVVCDLDDAAAGALAAPHGARTVRDADALGRASDVDLVVVATPNHLHVAPALAGLAAGKAVFVEKPLAITLDDCDALVGAAADAGRPLLVGHVMRTFPGVRRMLDEARGGGIGRLLGARGARSRRQRQAAPSADWWKRDRTRSGGELLHELHELDLMVWLFGEPDRVSAVSGSPRVVDGVEVDSTHLTQLRWRDGAVATHELSNSAHDGVWGLRIDGDEASLVADFIAAEVRRVVDGRVVERASVLGDEAADESLRDASRSLAGQHAPGERPAWLRVAVAAELDEVARGVRGEPSVLAQAPDLAVRTALRARDAADAAAAPVPQEAGARHETSRGQR